MRRNGKANRGWRHPDHSGYEAGGAGTVLVLDPIPGHVYWITEGDTGSLHQAVYLGKTGRVFDQYEYIRWRWLSGPEAGREQTGYGRTWYTVNATENRRGSFAAALRVS